MTEQEMLDRLHTVFEAPYDTGDDSAGYGLNKLLPGKTIDDAEAIKDIIIQYLLLHESKGLPRAVLDPATGLYDARYD